MARVAYAVVKHDQPYHGYHEHALPSGSIPLKRAVGARATPVDNARTFRWDPTLY